jgi:hypothetical protein
MQAGGFPKKTVRESIARFELYFLFFRAYAKPQYLMMVVDAVGASGITKHRLLTPTLALLDRSTGTPDEYSLAFRRNDVLFRNLAFSASLPY